MRVSEFTLIPVGSARASVARPSLEPRECRHAPGNAIPAKGEETSRFRGRAPAASVDGPDARAREHDPRNAVKVGLEVTAQVGFEASPGIGPSADECLLHFGAYLESALAYRGAQPCEQIRGIAAERGDRRR